MRTTKTRRQALLAQIHIGRKRWGISEEQYRDWLQYQTGQRSCGELSDLMLEIVAEAVRSSGMLDAGARGGSGEDRPTDKQWAKLGWLARQMGWNGLSDERMNTFVKHMVKVESTRFLTRDGARDVIAGLTRWREYLSQQAAKAPDPGAEPSGAA
jgi:phage gp16-like protein